jgi:2-polyprenyl-3-methyl-5-hydroxy-6-metoxy-1,4-benzoquinol methylase
MIESAFSVDDIRPDQLMGGHSVAMQTDIDWLAARRNQFEKVQCPACGSDDYSPLYVKWSLDHVLCAVCTTQYANPRPTVELLGEFYRRSTNYAYFAKEIFAASRPVRLEKIFKPRARILADALSERGVKGGKFLEVGAAYGLFCSAVHELDLFDEIIAIEPTPDLAQICRDLNFDVIEMGYESATVNEAAAIAAFEVIEHLHDPGTFVQWGFDALLPGGCLFITCPNIRGFETMALGRESGAIDHEHINLFHPGSLTHLLERGGFVDVRITTPGHLDFDLVRRALHDEKVTDDDLGSFLAHVVRTADEPTAQAFQKFVRESSLSSHMMAVCFKPR